jgi:hypothetical protein
MINKKPIIKHQKLFATAGQGWLGYAVNNVLFIKQFPDTKPEDYSPKQGEIELYANKEKSYAELENHGRYSILQPGQSISYVVNWYLLPIPKEINSGQPNQQLSFFLTSEIDARKATGVYQASPN